MSSLDGIEIVNLAVALSTEVGVVNNADVIVILVALSEDNALHSVIDLILCERAESLVEGVSISALNIEISILYVYAEALALIVSLNLIDESENDILFAESVGNVKVDTCVLIKLLAEGIDSLGGEFLLHTLKIVEDFIILGVVACDLYALDEVGGGNENVDILAECDSLIKVLGLIGYS